MCLSGLWHPLHKPNSVTENEKTKKQTTKWPLQRENHTTKTKKYKILPITQITTHKQRTREKKEEEQTSRAVRCQTLWKLKGGRLLVDVLGRLRCTGRFLGLLSALSKCRLLGPVDLCLLVWLCIYKYMSTYKCVHLNYTSGSVSRCRCSCCCCCCCCCSCCCCGCGRPCRRRWLLLLSSLSSSLSSLWWLLLWLLFLFLSLSLFLLSLSSPQPLPFSSLSSLLRLMFSGCSFSCRCPCS